MTNGLPGFLEKDLRFIFFGGKGGVGKTTSAVAGALVLAERNPNKKILLVSIDPAHSVGDSFDQHIGDRVVPVQGVDHLFAREADAERLPAEFKLKNGPVLAKIADRGTYFDKEDIRSFLEMPDIARDWLGAAMKVILKYQGLVRLASISGLVMKYSKQVRKLRKQLLDAAGTEIVVVTIPEAMGVVDMKRLLQALRRFKIACRQIVINMVTPPDDCSFYSRKRDEEQGYVREVIAQCPDLRVGCVPRLPRPVRGLRNLLEFRRILYSTKAGDNSVPS